MAKFQPISVPKDNPEERVSWEKLSGGLNLWELDYRLAPDQSPEMRNLLWRDGLLGCRDGQCYVNEDAPGQGLCCYGSLFRGYAVAHLGDGLFAGIPGPSMTLQRLCGGLPLIRGSFFRCGDGLYYKTAGAYKKILWSQEDGLTAADVVPYVPVTFRCCDPKTGTGTAFEPKNSLSDRQILCYSGDGTTKTFALPLKPDAVTVTVGGSPFTAFTLSGSSLTFSSAPSAGENNVAVTCTVTPQDAVLQACTLGCVYGGSDGAAAVLAGAAADPNGCFWSMPGRPDYFPETYVNHIGDTSDPITGFGRQAGYLIVLQEHAVGRCIMDNGTLRYTTVNPAVGCDLPHTVRSVENNLVWCSTGGVYLLKSTNAAMENNVVHLSRNVDGCDSRPGLLQAVRQADTVCALEDGSRYWVVAGGQAFLWDHGLSEHGKPSWFYCTGIGAVDFFRTPEGVYHVDKQGRISRFVRDFTDYGGAIPKVYRFAVQSLGGGDRLKTVRRLVVTTRSDTDTLIRLRYETDRQERTDLTPIRSASWRLCPRNLSQRALRGQRFAHVAVRKPRCRHVQYFGLRLENNEPGADMSLVSAELFYTRDRRER